MDTMNIQQIPVVLNTPEELQSVQETVQGIVQSVPVAQSNQPVLEGVNIPPNNGGKITETPKEAQTKNTLSAIRSKDGKFSIGFYSGKERYICFDLNAFAEMESIYGSMEEAQEKLAAGSLTDIRKVLWIGMLHDEAVIDEVTGEPIKYNISLYEVGSWITMQNMHVILAALRSAISGALPEEEQGNLINAEKFAGTAPN